MVEIKQLLEITKNLREKYKSYERGFSLDGKLVGDIGEVLAAEKYGLKLLKSNENKYDAIQIATNRQIQIKSSFKYNFYFPLENNIPDYFLCVNINEQGELEEIYNGTGQKVWKEYIIKRGLKGYKTGYVLSCNLLKELNNTVSKEDKV